MGKTMHHKQISAFTLEGRFLGYVLEDGYKIKRLRLGTVTGEQSIKLTKQARASIGRILIPGDWIQVTGEQKLKESGEIRLKAHAVQTISPRELKPEATVASKPKASILVCQKSDCAKRGGKAICRALEQALDDRGLSEQVTIKPTGCMKNCKAGPNLVMPGKCRYSQIQPEEIPALVDRHFPSPEPESIPENLIPQALGNPLPTI